jgi:hypothetical protein
MSASIFCNACKEYNCTAHARPKSLTQRLTNLLEYFESDQEETPEKEMRSYISPDTESFDRHDRRLRVVGNFSEDSLKDMSKADKVVMMPKADVTTTAIVHVGHTGSANKEFLPNKIPQLTGGKYRSHERHHFMKIHASSFVSCSSPTGTYSEIAIILWMDGKHYSSKSSVSSDRYRVVLNLMYDAVDDLWSVSSKLIKRGIYLYSKDEDEGQISNRLCLTSELRSEIKKMLLYLGLSPREAYRKFRKNMEETFVKTESEFGFTTIESESHATLIKELEKPTSTTTTTSTSTTGWDNHRQANYTNYGQNIKHHSRGGVDPDAYRCALAGYPGMDECWGGD